MDNDKLVFADETIRLINIVADREISSTQSIKTLIIEKGGNRYIAFQKWWRESMDKPWREGKGFHLTEDEATNAIDALEEAQETIKNNAV